MTKKIDKNRIQIEKLEGKVEQNIVELEKKLQELYFYIEYQNEIKRI